MGFSHALLATVFILEGVTATWVVNFHNNNNGGCPVPADRSNTDFDLQALFQERLQLLIHGDYRGDQMELLFGAFGVATLTETASGTVTQHQNWQELADFLNSKNVPHKVVASTIYAEPGHALFRMQPTAPTQGKAQTQDFWDDIVGAVAGVVQTAVTLGKCVANAPSYVSCVETCQITVTSTMPGQPDRLCNYTRTDCSRTSMGHGFTGPPLNRVERQCPRAACSYPGNQSSLICNCVNPTGQPWLVEFINKAVQDCIDSEIPQSQLSTGSPQFSVIAGSFPGKTLADCAKLNNCT